MIGPRKWLIGLAGLIVIGVVGWFWDPLELKTPPPPPMSPIEGRVTMLSGDYDGTNLMRFRANDGAVYAVHLDPTAEYGPLDRFQNNDSAIIIEWEMRGDRPMATDIAPTDP